MNVQIWAEREVECPQKDKEGKRRLKTYPAIQFSLNNEVIYIQNKTINR